MESPVFSVDSPRAKNVLACAKYMLSLTSDAQKDTVKEFSEGFYTTIRNIVESIKESKFSYSTQRTKLMTQFHQKRSTVLLTQWKDLWSKLSVLEKSSSHGPGIPNLEQIFVQHCCFSVFETLVEDNFPVEAQPNSQKQLSEDEQCALRYVAGYVIRNIK